MRQLRFLRPGDDGDHLIVETADRAEQFVLYVDPPLRDAVRADLPRLHPSATPAQPEATISPRDIQVRVRAGASPEDLAEENGMSLDRVMRFAGPVLDERARVASEARRAKARRSTTEGQTVYFGEAVDARFAAHGIDPYAVAWDARRRPDGQWVVTAEWLGGETQRVAEWIFHLNVRNVTPVDDTAADLLSDRPIRPVVSAVDEPERPSLAAAPPLAPGVVAFPTMGDLPVGLPTAAQEEVFDQDALDALDGLDEDPRHIQSPVAEYHAPPLPLRLAEPPTDEESAADGPAEALSGPEDPAGSASASTNRLPKVKNLGVAPRSEEGGTSRPAHPRVPSWDDILLGVRRSTD